MDDAERSRLKTVVCDAVDSMADRLIELSHRIHASPELQFEEVKASGWLTEMLEAGGLSVERGLCGMPTSFIGRKVGRSGGPKVACVAEYDALAEVGHACGHNILGTSNVGAAIALGHTIGELDGEVLVFGTPAEEGGGGKIPFVEQGYFDDVAAVVTMHPQGHASRPTVGGRCLAVQPLTFKFYGRAAHAAGNPHEGINALDALIQTFNGINAMRQHVRQEVRIHGTITHGGGAPNVTPDFTQGEFLVRAPSAEEVRQVTERVIGCAQAGALATGARMEVERGPFYEDMWPNAALGRAAVQNLAALGLDPVPTMPYLGSYSTDLGNISRACPTTSISMPIAGRGIGPHHRDFAAAAASPAGDLGLIHAAKAIAMTAIDVLTDPELRQQARAQWQSTKDAAG